MQVIIPSDKVKLRRQIQALKYLIKRDTNEKDRGIHEQAMRDLQVVLEP